MMDAKTIEYRKPQYTVDGYIDCEIHVGADWLPYTASPDDVVPFSVELFNRIQDAGGIKSAPIIPVKTKDEKAAEAMKGLKAAGSPLEAFKEEMVSQLNELRTAAGLATITVADLDTNIQDKIKAKI